jgi:hypothetical protein
MVEGVFRQPKNSMPEIKSLYLFLSVDPDDGNEGVCAAPLGNLAFPIPMIAADEIRLGQLRPLAQQLATELQMRIKLVKLSVREELETFDPANTC